MSGVNLRRRQQSVFASRSVSGASERKEKKRTTFLRGRFSRVGSIVRDLHREHLDPEIFAFRPHVGALMMGLAS